MEALAARGAAEAVFDALGEVAVAPIFSRQAQFALAIRAEIAYHIRHKTTLEGWPSG